MRRTLYILFIVLAVAGTGCSSKKKGGSGGGGGTGSSIFPPVTDPVNPGTNGGATVNFVLDSKSALDTYMGWSSCSPTATTLNIQLHRIAYYSGGNQGFGGTVAVSFKDQRTACGASTNPTYTDTFSSMLIDSAYNTKSDDTANHAQNLLSYSYPGMNGKLGYRGFFETTGVQRLVPPTYGAPLFGGAVVLIIDSTNDLNDGSGPSSANGSIWFKNVIAQYPMGPFPNTNCWWITTGPYQCGTNLMTSGSPGNGYQRLGTFTGLEIKKALNNEI